MIDIRGDSLFFNVSYTTEWDSTINNHMGGNKLVVDIMPAGNLLQMQTDIESLRIDLERMQREKDAEVLLRNSNPTLKDAYEKYETVYKLMKQTIDAMEGNDGGG